MRPFEEIEKIAYGWLNMTPDELDEMTIREFNLKLAGWREKRKKDSAEKWEIMRYQTWLILRPFLKRGSIPNPKSLFRLNTDEAEAPTRTDEPILKGLAKLGASDDFLSAIKKDFEEKEKQDK